MAIGVNVSNGRAQRWQTGMQCGAACKMDKLNKPPSRMETHQEAGGQRRQSKNYVRAARGVDRLMLELRSRGHAWQATGGGATGQQRKTQRATEGGIDGIHRGLWPKACRTPSSQCVGIRDR